MAKHGIYSVIADGETVVVLSTTSNSVTFNINGTFGGGTLSAGYRNFVGAFEPYAGSAILTGPGQVTLDCGLGVEVMFSLAGATAPSIFIEVHKRLD